MAREAGIGWWLDDGKLERFAALVAAAEREKVAAWMIQRGYATGHGDTVEDLLKELDWQTREAERREWVGLEQSDMPDGDDPIYDDPRFIAGIVWAAKKLLEKNT